MPLCDLRVRLAHGGSGPNMEMEFGAVSFDVREIMIPLRKA
jgi:hypothetical protein